MFRNGMDNEDKIFCISICCLKDPRWHVCFPRLFSFVSLSFFPMFFLKSLFMPIELMSLSCLKIHCIIVFVKRVKLFMRREKSCIISSHIFKITDVF